MSASDPNQPVHSDYEEKVSVVSEHAAAAAREKPDPKEGTEPVSLWAFLIAGIALIVGAGYLGATNGGFSNGGLTFVEGYTVDPAPGGDSAAVQLTPGEQWLVDGKKQYSLICAACHLGNGAGQGGLYPPIAGSEWVTGGTERLAMILLNGLQGPITVAGKPYNNVMNPWKEALNDKKMAQVMSYIRMEFGNAASYPDGNGLVSAEMVAYAREKHDITGMTVSHLDGFDKDLPGPKLDLVTLEPIEGSGVPQEAPAE